MADLAPRPGGQHAGKARAARDERAGIDERLVFAARPKCTDGAFVNSHHLANGQRFAREEGFVSLEICCIDEHCIGGNAITLFKDEQVIAHDLSAGNADAQAIANDQRSRV
ncbi:hypothetical protein GGQ88_003388 [Novosphingobium hassiacum]|uniref:Uncharacterized protein n=1 Tax=Novosphingobium hassiacum TaxID=173676 RepID=A0A7W6A0U1_9SPHN|nr:hypothetical protein [Novosphingobium hassiacum]